ncbi:MAG TPA: alanine racemase [Solirubrobacteraceae bacterium]|nr:alanine racemase [Solirubrobacteraceae bacterium]
MPLRAVAAVNLAAIERNCARLRAALAPGARLSAVVKGNGYGHGAVAAGQAALAGGAELLCVAAAGEARELHDARVGGPVLVLGALSREETLVALEAHAEVVAWREAFVERLAGFEVSRPGHPGRSAAGVRVHVKLDSGMGRLGTRDADEARRVADRVATTEGLHLVGVMTHFATADERGDAFFGQQLERFAAFVDAVRAEHPDVVAHAANSAATLRDPGAHFDLVRCGVAVYGLDPFQEDPAAHELEPALELRSYVADVKPCAPGESAGYGRRFVAERDTVLGVLPLGYGDGWRRDLSGRADALVAGERRPLVGTVSMDNVTVDLGPEPSARPGDEAVLIGARGAERILAEELARRMGTINYEITTGLLARVHREYHRDGEPA